MQRAATTTPRHETREREHLLRRGRCSSYRQTSGSNYHTRDCSASPTCHKPLKPRTPEPTPFRNGASSQSPAACAICLGRHLHNVRMCASTTTWEGGKVWSRRGDNGRLFSISSGAALCLDWQQPVGCSSNDHPQRHICSGCGKTDHGAQNCPRTQKA